MILCVANTMSRLMGIIFLDLQNNDNKYLENYSESSYKYFVNSVIVYGRIIIIFGRNGVIKIRVLNFFLK